MRNETINNNSYAPSLDAKDALLMLDKGMSIADAFTKEIKEASKETVAEMEKAEKSRVEVFSNEKGKALNEQYQQYLEGSIKENFEVTINLTKQKIALMEEISEARIALEQEKAKAKIEMEAIEQKIAKLKAFPAKMWAWRITYPLLGVLLGVATYLLLHEV